LNANSYCVWVDSQCLSKENLEWPHGGEYFLETQEQCEGNFGNTRTILDFGNIRT